MGRKIVSVGMFAILFGATVLSGCLAMDDTEVEEKGVPEIFSAGDPLFQGEDHHLQVELM